MSAGRSSPVAAYRASCSAEYGPSTAPFRTKYHSSGNSLGNGIDFIPAGSRSLAALGGLPEGTSLGTVSSPRPFGTCMGIRHLGHKKFLPPAVLGTRRVAPQALHDTRFPGCSTGALSPLPWRGSCCTPTAFAARMRSTAVASLGVSGCGPQAIAIPGMGTQSSCSWLAKMRRPTIALILASLELHRRRSRAERPGSSKSDSRKSRLSPLSNAFQSGSP